jgi:hypothetical protein
MFHLLANDVATTGAGPGVFYQAPAVPDPEFSQSGALDYQIPKDLFLAALALIGNDVNDGRINTATTRLRGFPKIYPFEVGTVFPSDPNVMDLRKDNLRLRSQEDYRVEVDDQGGGAAAADFFSVISDVPLQEGAPPPGSRWVRFTCSAVTQTALWSGGPFPLALSDVLEASMYAVYGMRFLDDQQNTALAARLWFQGQTFKPGCLAEVAIGDRSHEMFRGGLGLWGTFNLYSLPQVDIFDTAANGGATTYLVDLLLSRIG